MATQLPAAVNAVFAGQERHTPDIGEYVPAAHGVHALDVALVAYVPKAHDVHAVLAMTVL